MDINSNIERLFLVVSDACSANCRLCNYWKTREPWFLDEAAVKEKISPVISRTGVLTVLITGGEPTLNPHLPAIIKEIHSTGSQCTLITNGTRLEDFFINIRDYVGSYMFSLDAGNKELHKEIRGLDNFDHIVAWPEKIASYRSYTPVVFNCLLQKKNVGHLVELYRLAVELPVGGIFFNVPEIKPFCFGPGTVNTAPGGNIPQDVLLTGDELDVLEEEFKTIRGLDMSRGKVFQREEFFKKAVKYFRKLRHGTGPSLNPPGYMCPMPYGSAVFDENRKFRPCFYLPDGVSFSDFKDCPKVRERYCKDCLQFQV